MVQIYNEINILLQSVSPLKIGIVQIKLTFSQQQFSTWLLRKAFREADGWNPDSESASMWGNQGEEEDTIGQVGHAVFLALFLSFFTVTTVEFWSQGQCQQNIKWSRRYILVLGCESPLDCGGGGPNCYAKCDMVF